MESLGTSPKQNDGDGGRVRSETALSLAATAPLTLTEKQAMKKEKGVGVCGSILLPRLFCH